MIASGGFEVGFRVRSARSFPERIVYTEVCEGMPDGGGTPNSATFTEVDGHAMLTLLSLCARVGRSAMRSSKRGWKRRHAGADGRSGADCHLVG